MAHALNSGARGKTQAARISLLTLSLASCTLYLPLTPAFAETLDPTRPPTGLSDQAKGPEATQAAPLRVSSVFLMGGRSYAIVAGQTVRVGDRLDPRSESRAGAGRVVKIDETGVWLRTASGLRQLKLLPEVKKTPAGKMEKR